MLFLRPSPDDIPGGVTVADPPIEAPPEVVQEDAPPEEVAPEAKPPEGEDAGTGEDDPKAQVREAIQELLKEDPELAEALGIKAPQEEQLAPDEALSQREYGLNQRERHTTLQQWEGLRSQFAPDNIAGALRVELQAQEREARAAIKKAPLVKDQYDTPVGVDADSLPLLNADKMFNTAKLYVQKSQQVIENVAYATARTSLLDALESLPEYRILNAEEKAAWRMLTSDKPVDETGQPIPPADVIAILPLVLLEAARRNAPEAVMKKADEKVKKDTKLTEAQARLLEIVRGSSNGAKLAGGKGSDRRTDETRLADPKTPPSELEAILRRQGKL